MRVSKGNSTMPYNIDMTSITEQDWEELMDNINNCMENARDIRNSKEDKKEESLELRIYNKLYMKLHGEKPKEH
ncbi:MAG: hypothetical protein E7262_11410 [Lachnospiraceae bacterium]|nr:hypothetical protein [Lachnospiraceae bacterium]